MSPSRGVTTTKRQTLLLAIATVSVVHLVVYRATATLRTAHLARLAKRDVSGDDHEPATDALIDWLALYRSASPQHRPVVFAVMTLWLIFLFAFVGICASEFFCPNLSHIASRLGLSESVAGVTFLAFSNGSPDVFSTFSALKANAGSLAIGELIGAASFIVSVVAGTMALITPFRVSRHTFLRDVGFFTLATLLTLGILYDSHIHLWEALTMVGLYVVYVAYVAVGGWWWTRREDRRRKLREARDEYDHRSVDEGGLGFGLDEEEVGTSGERSTAHGFEGGAEIEWEHSDDDDDDDEDGLIHLPVSGSTTPRSTTGRSITSAFSSDSIIYHPSQRRTLTASSRARGSITPPPLVSPRLPRHSHSHIHHRSRSTSLINPSLTGLSGSATGSARPPPTPLLSNSISSLSNSGPTNATGGGSSASGSRKSQNRVVGKTARPSLLGAIEFRDLVNSLHQERDSANNVLSVFDPHRHGSNGFGTGGVGSGGSQRQRPGHSRTSTSTSSRATASPALSDGVSNGGTEWNWNGWPGTTTSGGGGRRRASSSPGFRPGALRLDGEDDTLAERVLSGVASISDDREAGQEENPWARQADEHEHGHDDAARAKAVKKVPSILLTSTNGSDTLIPTTETVAAPELSDLSTVTPSSASSKSSTTVRPRQSNIKPEPSSRQRRSILFRAILAALFPSLSQFASKSIVGKVTALICVPALLVLNLTLPVAEEINEDDSTCGIWDEREDEEKEDNVPGGVPKGIRLPEDDDDGTTLLAGSEGVRGEAAGDDDEAYTRDAADRIGKRLHSPAIAHPHPHHHAHSHHLSTAVDDDASPHPPLLDLGLDEEPVVATSPWVDQASNPPAPPSHHFRIASTESDGTVNRVNSPSESSAATTAAAHERDEAETESILLEKLECDAARRVTRGLTAVQCTLGPIFCACALFADELKWYQPVLALVIGAFFATLAWRFFHDPRHPGRVTLCFVGFGIAMVWILMIVNEVVGVLQTLGHIFGISDAILGLTIFAMGNSLGDLVANATVARMGYPSMAIAACFGGPMLNILLGVGLSGTYLIALSPTRDPIHVEMGRTLMVSGIGLFAILVGSLIVVPMNGYRMTKRIGAILIGAYTIVLSINVAAEIWL